MVGAGGVIDPLGFAVTIVDKLAVLTTTLIHFVSKFSEVKRPVVTFMSMLRAIPNFHCLHKFCEIHATQIPVQ